MVIASCASRSLHLHKETCNSAGCSSYQLIIQYTGSESYAQRMVYTLRTNIWRTSIADSETVVPYWDPTSASSFKYTATRRVHLEVIWNIPKRRLLIDRIPRAGTSSEPLPAKQRLSILREISPFGRVLGAAVGRRRYWVVAHEKEVRVGYGAMKYKMVVVEDRETDPRRLRG